MGKMARKHREKIETTFDMSFFPIFFYTNCMTFVSLSQNSKKPNIFGIVEAPSSSSGHCMRLFRIDVWKIFWRSFFRKELSQATADMNNTKQKQFFTQFF